ncbi:MAG: NAD(P)-dependent oxidoreductase [Candidatus Eremiobacteraeota bacterium]|nr:NAD(P)-dependent oxidoreductase [Candidatus Eremiobacteraeota bacterium]
MEPLKAPSRVGIVGTGRMGANIALRLNDTGWNVEALYDADPASANVLSEQVGAVIAATLADVTDLCDVVLTAVSDDAATLSIFAEKGDSLLAGAKDKLFINCATLSPAVHVEAERRARSNGAQAIEACMAGSMPQARSGTLFLMCAGDRDAFERSRPLLEAMASEIHYLGGPGKAAETKALVNMLMNINTAGLAEGLGLGDSLGLDLTELREIFSKTGAASRVLETDGADMQMRDHETYFSAAHAAKDSNIALQLARDVGLNLPLAAAAAAQYDRMVTQGIGDLDKSGIAELTFQSRRAKS